MLHKFCADCKHHLGAFSHMCVHPEATDLIANRTDWLMDCRWMRATLCGPDAKWWEPSEPPSGS